MLVALAGGVGAARFLRGLVRVVDPRSVTVVVNTADDDRFHGLAVSPDLDTVTYTLAGAEHPEQGWGLADESFRVMDALDRYGVETWFRLGRPGSRDPPVPHPATRGGRHPHRGHRRDRRGVGRAVAAFSR